MDTFKKETVKDYTSVDLNHSCPYKPNHKKKEWQQLFKRKARRKFKQNLKKDIDNY